MNSGLLIGLVITVVLTAVFFLIGYIFLRISRKWKRIFYERTLRCTVQTEAEVKDIAKVLERNVDSYYMIYYPIYTYRINNNRISQISQTGIKPETLKPGQHVVLFYNPYNPADFYVPAEDNEYTCKVFYNISIAARVAACVTFFVGTLVTILVA